MSYFYLICFNFRYIYAVMHKRWKKEEITDLIKMHKDGYKLKILAQKFNVTSNAIRKTLSRHSIDHIKIKKIEVKAEPSVATIDQILQWAKSKNILKVINNKMFFLGNKINSIYNCVAAINNHRIKNGLPIFQVRYFNF